MKLLWGFLCVFLVFLCLLAACEFFMTFFKLKKKKKNFPLRGFGMRSSLWYKYRLIVLGSITYTPKPLNSTENFFQVIPSTHAALKNRVGLWEHLTQFGKDAMCFFLISPFLMFTVQSSQGDCCDSAGTGHSLLAVFSDILTSSRSRALSNFLQ